MPPESSAQAQARAFLAQMLQQPGSPAQVRAIQRLMESVTHDEQTAHEVLRRLGGQSVPDVAPPSVVPPTQPPPVPSPAPTVEGVRRPAPEIPSGPGSLPPGMRGIAPTPRTAAETAEVQRRRISGITKTAPAPIDRPAPPPEPLQYQQQSQGLWGSDPERAEELLDFAHGVELWDLPALGYEIKRGFKPFVQGLVQQAKKEGKKLTLKALRRYLTKKVAKAAVPTAAGSVFGPAGTAAGATAGTALGIGSTAWDVAKLGGRLAKGGWQNIPRANRLQQVGRAFSMPVAATAGAARIGEGVLSGDPLGVGLGVGEIGLGVGLPLVGSSTRLAQAGRRLAGEGPEMRATLRSPLERTLAMMSGTPSPTAATAEAQLLRRIEGIQGARDAQLPKWPRPLSEAAADTPDPTPTVEPPVTGRTRERPAPTGPSGQRVVDEAQRPTPPPGEIAPTTRVTDLGLTVPSGGKPRGAFRKVLKEVVAAAEPEQAGRGLGKTRLNTIIRQAQQDATGNSQASQWVKEALATHYNVTPDELVAPVQGRKRTRKPKSTAAPETPEAAVQPRKIPYSSNPELGTADAQEAWRVATRLVGTEADDAWDLVESTDIKNVNRLAHQILQGDLKGSGLDPEEMQAAQQAILEGVTAKRAQLDQLLKGEPAHVVDEVVDEVQAPAPTGVLEGRGDPIPEGFERLVLPKGAESVEHKSGLFKRAREVVSDTFGMPISTKPRGNTDLNRLTGQILTRPEDLQQANLRNQIIREVMGEGALVETAKVPKGRTPRTPKVTKEAGKEGIDPTVVEEVADVVPIPPETGAAARVVAATPEQLDELDTGFEQLVSDIRNLADEDLGEELADARRGWEEVFERAVDRTRVGVEGIQHPAGGTVAAREQVLEIADELIAQTDALDPEAQAYVNTLRERHGEVGGAMAKVDAPTGSPRLPRTDPPTAGEAGVKAVPTEYTAKQLRGRSKRVLQLRKDYLKVEGATTKTWNAAKRGDEAALRSVNATLARAHGTGVTGEVEGPARQLQVARGAAEVPKSPKQLFHLAEQAREEATALASRARAVEGAEEITEQGRVLSDVPTMVGKLKTPQEALTFTIKLQRSVTAIQEELVAVLNQIADLPAHKDFFTRTGSGPTKWETEAKQLIAKRRQLRTDLEDQEAALSALQEQARTHEGVFFERTRAGDVPSEQRALVPTALTDLNTTIPALQRKVGNTSVEDEIRKVFSGRSSTVEGATQADVLLDSIRRYAEAVQTGVVGTTKSAAKLFSKHLENLALHLVDAANEAGRVTPRKLDPPGSTEAKLGRKPYGKLKFAGEGQKGWTLRGFGKGGRPGTRTGKDEGFTFFQSFDADMADPDVREAVHKDAINSLQAAFGRIQQEGQAAGEAAIPASGVPFHDVMKLVEVLEGAEAPEQGKRIWTQFVRMNWARRQALKADGLMQTIWSDPTAPKQPFDDEFMDVFQALYDGSVNEITRWANAIATSQLPPGTVKWKPSTKASLLRYEQGTDTPRRAHKKLWKQDIDVPRANLTAWRTRKPTEAVQQMMPQPAGAQGLTVERMGQELDDYLKAVNSAVEAAIAARTGGNTLNLMMNVGMIPRKHLPAAISGTVGGLGGWEQGENIVAEEGMTGLPAAATRLATTAGGMAFGAATPGYLAPRLITSAKGTIKTATKAGSLMMNWLLSSPRSILKAWMGAHNGTIYAGNERILEGLYSQLGSLQLKRTATTPRQKERAIKAETQGRALVKDGLNILKGVAGEDLRFAANLVPKAVRKHLGAFDAFADKSLIKQVFGLDVTTPEGKQAMRGLSAQFSRMTDEQFEALLESDRLDGRLSNAIIGRLFRSADWAFQNIMTKNNVPFEKARQYTLTGKLDTADAQRVMDFFQPPKGPTSTLGTVAKKLVSPVPRVGLQALERGVERTLAPVHYLAKRAMGAPQVRPSQSPFGKLTPRSTPDALAKLTTAGGAAGAGALGTEHLNPRLQPMFAAFMGPGAIPATAAAGVMEGLRAGTNPLTGAISRISREAAPINLEGQAINTSNIGGELLRRLVVPSHARDWAQIGDLAAPEGRISSGPQLMRALAEGSLDLSRPGGAFLENAMTLGPKWSRPWTTGAAAELMLASPYHRQGLPPKPLVNRDVMGQEAFPVGGLPAPPTIPFLQEGWQTLRRPSTEAQVNAAAELLRGPQPQTFGSGGAQPVADVLQALGRVGSEAVGRTLFPTYQSMRPTAPTGIDPVLQELATWGAADLVQQRGLPGFTPDPTTGGGLRDPLTNLPTTPQRRGRELAAEVAGQEMAGIYDTVQGMMASGQWEQLSARERRLFISQLRRHLGALPGGGGNRVAGAIWRRPPVP
jgi:hypothetical protein